MLPEEANTAEPTPAVTPQPPAVPLTGPAAIRHALTRLNLDDLETKQRDVIRKGQVSHRNGAVQTLNALEGLRRNQVTPDQLFVRRIPVIPPGFRPFSAAGDTFVPGDANELYGEAIKLRDAHLENRRVFGAAGAQDSLYDLYRSTKALYGYGEPVTQKMQTRGVTGFLQQVSGCHDDATEILTLKHGWILFRDLPEDTAVATVNPDTLAFEWQMPSDYQHFRYIGEMFHFRKKTRLDAMVTPGHTMWVKPRGRVVAAECVDETYMRSGWIKQPAYVTAAATGRRWLQTSSCGWEGQFHPPAFFTGDPVAFARLVGLWLAEGWLKRKNRTLLCQCPDSNPGTVILIRETIEALKLPFTEEHLNRAPGGFNTRESRQFRWSIDSEPLNRWLLQSCGSGSAEKFISQEVKNWPVELLRELFQAYLHGDGNKRQTPPSRNGGHTHKFRNTFTDLHDSFSTVSEKLQGDWTEVGLKLGLSIYRRKPCPDGEDAGIYRSAIIGRWNSVAEEEARIAICDYDGYVHCCTVPNGLLITRRNTHTFVSGNSNPKFSWVQRKLISKPQDHVARGTITIDPELEMDQIGLPRKMAETIYRDYVIRRLVRSGVGRADAMRHVRDQTPLASRALEAEVRERPITYSRAPAWHKFNSLGGWPKLIDGDSIAINPFVTTGMNADFNGDNHYAKILLACRTDEIKGYHNLDLRSRLHQDMVEAMLNKQIIPAFNTTTHDLYLLDLEDFPRGDLMGRNPNGRNGPIDFFHVPPGTQVIAFDEATGQPTWADVSSYSVHYGRLVEIVDLSNGRQITTDDDPRAIYGIDPAIDAQLRRFTPTQALERSVLVPCVKDVAGSCQNLGKLDEVAIVGDYDEVLFTQPLSWDFGYLLGALAGDGWWDKVCYGMQKRVYLSDLKGHVATKVHAVLQGMFGPTGWDQVEFLKADHPERYGDTVRHTFTFDGSTVMAEFLSKWLGGEATENSTGSGAKHLPDFFLLAPREFREGMLNGLIDTDGSISTSGAKGKPQLMCSFTSTSLRLASDVKFLCLTLGAQASLSYSKTTVRGNTSWIVNLSTVDIKRLGLFDRLASPWKRDAYLTTEVEPDNTSLVFDKVPVWDSLHALVTADLAAPKIKAAERKMVPPPPDLAARKEAQNFYIQWWKTKEDKLVSRSFAVRLMAYLAALQREADDLRLQAIQDLEQDSDITTPERITLWRKAIQATCPFQDEPERMKDGRRVYACLNAPLRAGSMSRKSRARVATWLRETPPYRNAAQREEVLSWLKCFVEQPAVGWSRVTAVQRTGIREDGYDLTVPGYETFMAADGLILSNTINVHVPALPDTVKEAKDILMPSKMLFSIRNQEDVMPKLKHEQVLGLFTAQRRTAQQVHDFPTREAALKAIQAGNISLQDEITINGKP